MGQMQCNDGTWLRFTELPTSWRRYHAYFNCGNLGSGWVIRGFQPKSQSPQGYPGDDLAMTDIQVLCGHPNANVVVMLAANASGVYRENTTGELEFASNLTETNAFATHVYTEGEIADLELAGENEYTANVFTAGI